MDQKIEAPTTLYLEDLSVHQRFTSGLYHMEEDRMKAFAAEFRPAALSPGRSGCPTQRLPRARRERVAHSGCYDASSGGEPAICERNDRLGWRNCLAQADASRHKLRVESEILEIVASRSKPNQGVVIVRCITLNQKGDHVQAFTAKILVFKRPGDPNNTILSQALPKRPCRCIQRKSRARTPAKNFFSLFPETAKSGMILSSKSRRNEMKAILVHEFGGPEVLKLEEVPTPRPPLDRSLCESTPRGKSV